MSYKSLLAISVLVAVLTANVLRAHGADDGSSFTIRPQYSQKEIYQVYEQSRRSNQPQFITTDLVLHTGHLLFDYSLRAIEIDRLYSLADRLTLAMVESIQAKPMGDDRDATLAYFCVPTKILNPEFQIPEQVREIVETDLKYIEEHKGFKISMTLDSAEDFSQYVPRGHYTRNEKFKRYFKAMMWYGRRMFRVEEVRPGNLPIPEHWSEGHLLAETRQMLKITKLLHELRIDGKPAIETWKSLYVPTVLFAGRTEDLNPPEVRALMEEVWSGMPSEADLRADQRIREFAKLAAEFSKPKIDSSGAGRKGFGFMPQRFTPDSYITQCLVTDADVPFGEGVPPHPLPYLGNRKPRPFTWGYNRLLGQRRFMPRGLDVMAVFDCGEALEILKADGDTQYEGYDSMLTFLRKDVGEMMENRKEENLYYAWLYALQPMMKPLQSDHVPACLRSKAWLRKQLATSLASWAELRHDTILYVKQSSTGAPRGAGPLPRVMPGYVEPQPEVFRRIGKMVAKMHADLAALGVMPEGLERNYRDFSSICEKLAEIAEREINGEALGDQDDQFISRVAQALKKTTILPEELREKVTSEADAQMALIADVHTDTNAKKVLEEGVGTPFLLTVQMPLRGKSGKLTEFHGAVFSYYEFKQPMDDRLTDEAWQEMLAGPSKRPSLPSWVPVEE